MPQPSIAGSSREFICALCGREDVSFYVLYVNVYENAEEACQQFTLTMLCCSVIQLEQRLEKMQWLASHISAEARVSLHSWLGCVCELANDLFGRKMGF